MDYYANLTAHHLLTQTSGVGDYAPGSHFTYDSDSYIAHLSYLLNHSATKHAGMTERDWATKHFGAPLGLPNLYSSQGPDPGKAGDTPTIGARTDICAGGDQPVTCAEFLRVGQLLLNKGKWLGNNGTTLEMFNSTWSDMLWTPQMPTCNDGPYAMQQQYSLLSYLLSNNTRSLVPPTPAAPAACTPRNQGLVVVPGMPNGTLLALGAMSRFLLASQPHLMNQNGATSAFEMCFGWDPLDLWCRGHVSNAA